MTTTVTLTPLTPGPFGNKSLKWQLAGYLAGQLWVALPFATWQQAQAHAAERGWAVKTPAAPRPAGW